MKEFYLIEIKDGWAVESSKHGIVFRAIGEGEGSPKERAAAFLRHIKNGEAYK